jgi:ABC-type sulfate transport system permease subunit
MVLGLVTWLPDILTLLVVLVAAPLNWYVTYLLWRISRADPDGDALRIGAVLSTCVALIVTVFALIFLNNGLVNPVLTSQDTMIVTRAALLVLSVVPAAIWLRWYRGNGH